MYLNHIYYRRQEGFNCEKDERCFELLSESIKSVNKYLRIKPISPFIGRQSTEIAVAGLVLVELTTNGFSGSNNSLVQNHWEMSNRIANKPAIERILALPSGGDNSINQPELPKLDGEKKFNEKLRKANPERQINGALKQTSPWYKKFLRELDLTTLAKLIRKYQEPFETHIKLTDQNGFTNLLIDFENFKQGQSLTSTNGNRPGINIPSPIDYQRSKNGFKSRLSVKNDFESRNENQIILNRIESANTMNYASVRPKKEDDKLNCPIEQPARTTVKSSQPKGSSSSSFGVDGWTMPTVPSSRPTQNKHSQPLVKPLFSVNPSEPQSGSPVPTPERFSANQDGDIQDINRAFHHFRERMTEIADQYSGAKRKYFLQELNACTIDRFESLSTERGRLTIIGVREAETILQSEFEGIHKSNSLRRTTDQEYQAGNGLDARFEKGVLSGEFNTLNEGYTDADMKVFVSDLTLQLQAINRRLLGSNPNKLTMHEQGYNSGLSVVKQKHKHCDPNKSEVPSSAMNVKHIINLLELTPSEQQIAKKSFTDGARLGWAKELNVPEHSISDSDALQGTIFLNEQITIKRID